MLTRLIDLAGVEIEEPEPLRRNEWPGRLPPSSWRRLPCERAPAPGPAVEARSSRAGSAPAPRAGDPPYRARSQAPPRWVAGGGEVARQTGDQVGLATSATPRARGSPPPVPVADSRRVHPSLRWPRKTRRSTSPPRPHLAIRRAGCAAQSAAARRLSCSRSSRSSHSSCSPPSTRAACSVRPGSRRVAIAGAGQLPVAESFRPCAYWRIVSSSR